MILSGLLLVYHGLVVGSLGVGIAFIVTALIKKENG